MKKSRIKKKKIQLNNYHYFSLTLTLETTISKEQFYMKETTLRKKQQSLLNRIIQMTACKRSLRNYLKDRSRVFWVRLKKMRRMMIKIIKFAFLTFLVVFECKHRLFMVFRQLFFLLSKTLNNCFQRNLISLSIFSSKVQ